MLCQICIQSCQFRANRLRNDLFGKQCGHHRTGHTLALSAEQGCQICSVVLNKYYDLERPACIVERAGQFVKGANGEEGSVWLTTMYLRSSYIERDEGNHYLSVKLWDDEYVEKSEDYPGIGFTLLPRTQVSSFEPANGNLSNNTGSNESWSLVVDWMKVCMQSHTRCNNTRHWYPTRLLDIGDPKLDGSNVRLVISASEALSGRYCTLSHCWGKSPLLQLTSATMEPLRSGIALDQMPKTFKEAILVSKRLGIRYIWIDSLCIKQDDKLDWRHEAGKMHEVYSNTFCNISAAASENSTQGLFRDRLPHTDHVSIADFCPDGMDIEPATIPFEVHDDSLWLRQVSRCVLNKRGWVLQERLLAPRVLHFGSNQLLWECREHEACETYPNGFGSVSQLDQGIKTLDLGFRRTANIGSEQTFLTKWPRIVEAYSKTSLTVSSDKLIALSGLANIFKAISNDEYIAGMWRSCLEQMLMWHASSDFRRTAVRPTLYRAPTWSWASLDGSIAMPNIELPASPPLATFGIQVRQVHLEYDSEDTTGAIKSGWLDLMGRLKPIRLVKKETESRWLVDHGNMVFHTPSTPLKVGPTVEFDVALDVQPSDGDSFHIDHAAQRLYIMICTKSRIHFLLLRLADEENRLFERIGVVYVWSYSEKVFFEADLGEDVKKGLPCQSYENGLHTIRII